jgi:hypothetical protein
MKRFALYIAFGFFGAYAIICLALVLVNEPLPFLAHYQGNQQFSIFMFLALGVVAGLALEEHTRPNAKK